jgi:membrane protease YdiL (CAAX protease family)
LDADPLARRTSLTLVEAGIVAAICFSLPVVGSVQSMLAGFAETGAGSGFHDGAAIYLIVMEALTGGVALAYLASRRYDLASLVPRPTIAGTLAGIGLYLVVWLVDAVVLEPFTTDGVVQPIDRMVEDSTMSTTTVVVTGAVNGLWEETFLLGVLVRALRAHGTSIAVGLPLLVRVTYHMYQGPAGTVSVLVFGLVLSAWVVRRGTLWPPVVAHVIGDIVPFVFAA